MTPPTTSSPLLLAAGYHYRRSDLNVSYHRRRSGFESERATICALTAANNVYKRTSGGSRLMTNKTVMGRNNRCNNSEWLLGDNYWWRRWMERKKKKNVMYWKNLIALLKGQFDVCRAKSLCNLVLSEFLSEIVFSRELQGWGRPHLNFSCDECRRGPFDLNSVSLGSEGNNLDGKLALSFALPAGSHLINLIVWSTCHSKIHSELVDAESH